MTFPEFIKNMSDYYTEKPSMSYLKVVKDKIGGMNEYQLNELYNYLVNKIPRSFKVLPGISDINEAFHKIEPALFGANIYEKNQKYIAAKEGREYKQIENKVEPIQKIDLTSELNKLIKAKKIKKEGE